MLATYKANKFSAANTKPAGKRTFFFVMQKRLSPLYTRAMQHISTIIYRIK